MSKCLIKVVGKNVRNFLIKIEHKKINVLKIKILSETELEILIAKKDVDLINEIKGIYEYEFLKEYGFSAFKNSFKKNMHLIFLLMINFILMFWLTNYIYEIEIVEDNHELREFISQVLEKKGIKKYGLKPKNLEQIKTEILKENKDYLEWIEIIPSGVKYIVKLEERIKNVKPKEDEPSNIIAKSDGTIKKIIAKSGKVLVEKETFVKKGDILITGIIDENKFVHAEGDVYAYVWYKLRVSESLHESVHELTGNYKKGFRLRFFNKDFSLYKKYKYNDISENIIFKNDILPFYLTYDVDNELNIVDHILTFEEAKIKALEKARREIQNKLVANEKIISENQLKVEIKDSKIILDILFTVYKNIREEERIEVDNVQGDFSNSNQ